VKVNEAVMVRLVSYGAYVLGVTGGAAYLGAPWGWLLLAVAGAIPGGYLLAKDMQGRELVRAAAANRPQSYQRPPDRSGPAAPEPLTMPPHAS
jgi:hypothetical protein